MNEATIYQIIIGFLLLLVFAVGRANYRLGVYDGAFNQFLPHVQEMMRDYDERRATEILDERKQRYGL